MAAAEEAAAGALLAARAGAMSREHQQPAEPPHPRCGAHWGRAARAAAATQPPPGTHSLARRPGRREDGTAAGERKREEEESGGPGLGREGGSPALRSFGESSPSKVISVQASAPSPPGPRRRRLAGQRVAESRAEDARPRRHSLVPRHRWLRKRRRPRRLPGPGRVAFEPRSQNKQLKMAATPLRHPPPSGTAPSALRLRAPRASPPAREQRGRSARDARDVGVIQEGRERSPGKG